jgi:hypothetical protein
VVLEEAFGVNDHIQDVTAACAYLAGVDCISPAWRRAAGVGPGHGPVRVDAARVATLADWSAHDYRACNTGLWVDDLDRMRDLYERLLGLTVTDEDADQGIVFWVRIRTSGRGAPRVRTAAPPAGPDDAKLTHRIS